MSILYKFCIQLPPPNTVGRSQWAPPIFPQGFVGLFLQELHYREVQGLARTWGGAGLEVFFGTPKVRGGIFLGLGAGGEGEWEEAREALYFWVLELKNTNFFITLTSLDFLGVSLICKQFVCVYRDRWNKSYVDRDYTPNASWVEISWSSSQIE